MRAGEHNVARAYVRTAKIGLANARSSVTATAAHAAPVSCDGQAYRGRSGCRLTCVTRRRRSCRDVSRADLRREHATFEGGRWRKSVSR